MSSVSQAFINKLSSVSRRMKPQELRAIHHPDHCKTLLAVFFLQQEKKSNPLGITELVFLKPPQSIPNSPEYTRIRRAIADLENIGLISLVRPDKTGDFRRHYAIHLDALVSLLCRYIDELPKYGAELSTVRKIPTAAYQKNRYVQGFIGMFFRGMAIEYLLGRNLHNAEWVAFFGRLNLRECLSLLLARWVTKEQDEEKKYYDKTTRDKELSTFIEFLNVLVALDMDFLPHTLLNGTILDMHDAVTSVLNPKAKVWKTEAKGLLENPDSVFSYHPTE